MQICYDTRLFQHLMTYFAPRKDLGTVLTCQAANNNMSVPEAAQVTLDMFFPPLGEFCLPNHRRTMVFTHNNNLISRNSGHLSNE
jgi:hypothetical protein